MSGVIARLWAEIGVDTSKLKSGLGGVKGDLANFATSLGYVTAGAGLATGALMAAGKVIKNNLDDVSAYAKNVRDLGRALGATPEEASKLISAADDVFVSVGTLQMGLEAAIRKGISPTIEGMGQLADEYLSIQDPIARTKFLMDTFGRSGADLAPLMEQGAAGIRKLGEEAEHTGQVMSGPALDAMLKYDQNMDALKDRTQGLSIAFAALTAEPASDFLRFLTNSTYALQNTIKYTNNWHEALGAPLTFLAQMAGMRGPEITAERFGNLSNIMEGRFPQAAAKAGAATDTLTKEYSDLWKVSGRSSEQQDILADAVREAAISAQEAIDPLFRLKLAIGDLKSKQIVITTILKTIGGTLTDADRAALNTGIGACFVGETLVNTPRGMKRIDWIEEGDRVVVYVPETGRKMSARVAHVKHAVRDDLVTVRTSKAELHCSPNHPFLTETGWVEAQNLEEGMRLIYKLIPAIVLAVTLYPGSFDVYDLEVDHPAHTYLVDGHVVHNKGFAEGGNVPAGLHSVGERGEEGLYVGPDGKIVVIPGDKWSAMKRGGVRPQKMLYEVDESEWTAPPRSTQGSRDTPGWKDWIDSREEGITDSSVPTSPPAPAPPAPSSPISEATTVMLQQQTEKAAKDAAAQLQQLQRIAQGVEKLNVTMPTVARDIANSGLSGSIRS